MRIGVIIVLCLGWTCLVYAAQVGVAEKLDGMSLLGGFLIFMAIFAGISYWVAEPAARKVLAEHVEKAEKAHPLLVSREEWDRKHLELSQKLTDIAAVLSALMVEVRTGKKR